MDAMIKFMDEENEGIEQMPPDNQGGDGNKGIEELPQPDPEPHNEPIPLKN